MRGDRLRDSVPTDMEHFCSAVLDNAVARPTIEALEAWGLWHVQTCVLLYWCEHGQSEAEDSQEVWSTSAKGLQTEMERLAKRIRRFHKLPNTQGFLGSLKTKAHNAPRFALWEDLISAGSGASSWKVSLSGLRYGPVSPSSVTSIERLPHVLEIANRIVAKDRQKGLLNLALVAPYEQGFLLYN